MGHIRNQEILLIFSPAQGYSRICGVRTFRFHIWDVPKLEAYVNLFRDISNPKVGKFRTYPKCVKYVPSRAINAAHHKNHCMKIADTHH